jgi:hypothetical protein
MADPSPAAEAEGQEPAAPEGQEPTPEGNDPKAEPEEGKDPKTYPESYVRQLRREAAGTRNRLAEAEEKLQEFADRDKSEHEKLTAKLTAAEKRAGDAETRLLRYEVAAERGLDAKAASFLTGTTREELELRAEELSSLLADRTKGKPAAGFDGGVREPAPTKGPPEQEHNDFLLRAMGRAPSK